MALPVRMLCLVPHRPSCCKGALGGGRPGLRGCRTGNTHQSESGQHRANSQRLRAPPTPSEISGVRAGSHSEHGLWLLPPRDPRTCPHSSPRTRAWPGDESPAGRSRVAQWSVSPALPLSVPWGLFEAIGPDEAVPGLSSAGTLSASSFHGSHTHRTTGHTPCRSPQLQSEVTSAAASCPLHVSIRVQMRCFGEGISSLQLSFGFLLFKSRTNTNPVSGGGRVPAPCGSRAGQACIWVIPAL